LFSGGVGGQLLVAYWLLCGLEWRCGDAQGLLSWSGSGENGGCVGLSGLSVWWLLCCQVPARKGKRVRILFLFLSLLF
jgi:hypothetical protein